jgi:hypothetical protein
MVAMNGEMMISIESLLYWGVTCLDVSCCRGKKGVKGKFVPRIV